MSDGRQISLRSAAIWFINVKVLFIALLICQGCAEAPEVTGSANTENARSIIGSEAKCYPLKIGEVTANLELALTEADMRKGLMHRADLPVDQGMLFYFDEPRRQSFWMRNTRIPLDIAFFDCNGRLDELRKLFPYVEEPVDSRSDKICYVVEMNQGWFDRNSIQVGDYIDIQRIQRLIGSSN